MNALADDARRQDRGRDASGFVMHDTSISSGDDSLATIRGGLRQDGKDALRRQALLDI